MTDKPWLKQYPDGIPAETDPLPWTSIPDFFDSAVNQFSDRPAVSNMGTELSFTRLDEISTHLANYLVGELNLTKGERVAIMMPNLLQHPVAILGILKAGLVFVNINPLYTSREVENQLNDSGAAAIIVLDNFCNVLESALPSTAVRHVIVSSVGDLLSFPKSLIVNFVIRKIKRLVPKYSIANAVPLKRALARGRAMQYNAPDSNLEDTAVLQYTGGTTGVCKSAVLTHRNLLTNMQQATLWISHGLPANRSIQPGREIVITALPLYHIFSLTANLLTFMNIGGLNHLITNPRDLPGFVRELKRTPFTCITGVNTLFNHLMHTPGFSTIDFSNLKISLGGGMAIQEWVAKEWQNLTGCPLFEAYGLTETSPAVCINPLNRNKFNGSIGLPIPSTECTIRDDEGRQLALDEIGELWVKGPQVMKEYWNRPDETNQVLTADGWLKTGDIAKIDKDGYVFLIDRKKDMIIVSGFNVYPNDVEAVISSHDDVLECGVVGIKDKECGEAVRAFVVKKHPDLSEQQLRKYCRTHLTAYKVPKSILFVPDLPKSNVGKILRKELRNRAC